MNRILKVEDKTYYNTKKQFLNYFGESQDRVATYPVKTGMYSIIDTNGEKCGNWILWCPNENKNDSKCTNIVSADGVTISETGGKDYLHTDNSDTNRFKVTRVVFSKTKNNGPWVFRGVFVPDYEKSEYLNNHVKNVFKRISTEIEIISKGRIRIIGSTVNPSLPDKTAYVKKPLNVIPLPYKPANDVEYVDEVSKALKDLSFEEKYIAEPKIAPAKLKTTAGEKYPRDPKIGAFAMKRAGFKCEFNPKHETFIKGSDGERYMEPHHLIPISQQGLFDNSLDVPANIVSLCCNCHKCIHYGTEKDKKIMLFNLYNERKEELEKVGILLSFEDLMKMY